MSVRARNRPLWGKYAFRVHDLSSGIREAQFQQATGAEITIAMGEYSEGGALAPMKEGTRASFSNITLQHGMFENEEIYNWVKEMCDFMQYTPYGAGVDSPDQLRNFAIYQLRRSRSIAKSLYLFNCQPARYKALEGDNTSDDLQVEELELAYDFFDQTNE